MKFFFSILILSVITYTNEQAPVLKALIETAATKTAFATTDEINVKITNSGDATAAAGAVSGLSLVAASVSKTVALTCAATQDTLAITNGAETVVCKPAAAEATAGVYVLTANSAKVGSVDLSVDTTNSKTITISASANADTNTNADTTNNNATNTTNTTTTNNNTEAGNYLKISFILLAIALLF